MTHCSSIQFDLDILLEYPVWSWDIAGVSRLILTYCWSLQSDHDILLEYPVWSWHIAGVSSLIMTHCWEGFTNLNPNSTGQGQSWSHQLWRQSPDKILTYQIIFYLTYTCRNNVFRIFLNFWHDIKKRRFDVHFDVFSSEVLSHRYSAVIPASDRFYIYYGPPERGRSPARPWSAVQCGANKIRISFRSRAA